MVAVPDILSAGILIVDDLKANVQLLKQMLGRAGYTHVTSTSDPRLVCGLYIKNRFVNKYLES